MLILRAMNHEHGRQAILDSNRLVTCAMPVCARPFAVCGPCDRGRRYCSLACSAGARRARQREASRLYQSTERGRLAHAARQARYRKRSAGVTHRSYLAVAAGAHGDRKRTRGGARSAPTVIPPSKSTPTQASSWCDASRAILISTLTPDRPPTCAFCRRTTRFLRHGPRQQRPPRPDRQSSTGRSFEALTFRDCRPVRFAGEGETAAHRHFSALPDRR